MSFTEVYTCRPAGLGRDALVTSSLEDIQTVSQHTGAPPAAVTDDSLRACSSPPHLLQALERVDGGGDQAAGAARVRGALEVAEVGGEAAHLAGSLHQRRRRELARERLAAAVHAQVTGRHVAVALQRRHTALDQLVDHATEAVAGDARLQLADEPLAAHGRVELDRVERQLDRVVLAQGARHRAGRDGGAEGACRLRAAAVQLREQQLQLAAALDDAHQLRLAHLQADVVGDAVDVGRRRGQGASEAEQGHGHGGVHCRVRTDWATSGARDGSGCTADWWLTDAWLGRPPAFSGRRGEMKPAGHVTGSGAG